MGITTTLTSITLSTAVGVALALGTTAGITPAEAAGPEPQPGIPNAQPEPTTWCQWEYAGSKPRTVSIFGNDIQAWRVKVRGTGTISINIPDQPRTWIDITLPKDTAEDDIRKVSCKVEGRWHSAEPS